jgi:predicted flap endonuclease-1-like 5' DNA nuclease
MRRSTKIVGILVGIGAGVAAVVWLLRDRLMGPEAMPAAPLHTPAFRVVPASGPRPTAEDDDLTRVKGIGPAFRARLASAGITRFADLAAASPGKVAEAAGVTEDRATEWIDQARQLAG